AYCTGRSGNASSQRYSPARGEVEKCVMALSSPMRQTLGAMKKFPSTPIRVRRRVRMLLLVALTLGVGVPSARAAEITALDGPWEVGLQTAYNFGITNNAQMVTFFPRVVRAV